MTYNLLLVDDEVHAVEGVKADLDLEKLQIGQLFVAYNAKQAKEILRREHVHIILCDIEMPQGSGFELTKWVREQDYEAVTIFLTSHADFRYAKEALRLGSLDYLLKPVLKEELEQVIRKAQAEINRSSELHKISQSHQLWMKHHSLIFERFWQDLINLRVSSNRKAIREQIELHQLPITDDMLFYPILISVQRWAKELNRRDEKIMEYALKNSAEEILLARDTNGMFFYLERGLLLGVITAESAEYEIGQIKQACEAYIHSCQRYFYCELSCYIGHPVEAHQISLMINELRNLNRNNVAYHNQVFVINEGEREELIITLPELNVWISLLKTGSKDSFIDEVERFLDQLVQKQTINATVLNQLHQDLMQVLYSYLNNEGIQAHKLFGDEYSMKLSEQASRSVRDLLEWVHHTVNKALKQAETVKESDSVVQIVQRYIAQHIDQDLSRESIAEMVYLNPDHLSRLFKKETGLSLSEYILTERIRIAKELLSQTDIPISSIASSVGHTNFSHFARIFRKHVGAGPSEYRQLLSRTD